MRILGFSTTILSSAGKETEFIFEAKLPIQEIKAKIKCIKESEEY